MATLIISLIIMHRVFGLKGLLIYELSVLEDFMKTRIDSFLEVFRKSKKPPLGVKPEWIAKEHRLQEIEAAIFRYQCQGEDIPEDWKREAQEIDDFLKNSIHGR
ncbi:hypothetical protein IDJ77_11275 [Mucilaginibacter sp. ZT4R22]|uniref:Uncharacterized protein n=2 Tax=Mucilaginibacter pankratovii TaxID=2772110 RepID=A0ABR7WQ12_9SPHI|nr:hypothetical protein [Mucilaginibacter pankratovii]